MPTVLMNSAAACFNEFREFRDKKLIPWVSVLYIIFGLKEV